MNASKSLELLSEQNTPIDVKMELMKKLLDASGAPEEKLQLFLVGTLSEYSSFLDEEISSEQKDVLIGVIMNLYETPELPSELKRIALETLRNLSRSQTNREKLFRREGLVDMLLFCAQSEPVHVVKTFAIGTLNNLAIADEMAQSLLKDKPQITTILVACALDLETIEDVREKAIKTIMNLAAAKENKPILVQQQPNVISALVECASVGDSEKVRERATKAISNLCTDHNNRIALYEHPKLVDTLLENAVSGTIPIKQIVLQTLFLLADAAQNKARMFQKPKLVDILLDCVQNGETATSGVKEWAMVTLIELMSVENHKVALFNKPMVVDILLTCINSEQADMTKIKEWALGALMVLASAEPNKAPMFEKPLVFTSIVKSIETKTDGETSTELAKEHAIGTLFNLSLNTTLTPHIYKQGHGLIYSLMDIVSAKGESNKVKTRANDLLGRLGISAAQIQWFLLMNTLCSGFDVPRLGRNAQYRILTKDLLHNIAYTLCQKPQTSVGPNN
jgi:hypothetical protein